MKRQRWFYPSPRQQNIKYWPRKWLVILSPRTQKGHVLLCSLPCLKTPALLFWQPTPSSPTKWGCCHIQSCLCCPAASQQRQHPVQYRADPGASAHTLDNLAPQQETGQFLKSRKREAVEVGGGGCFWSGFQTLTPHTLLFLIAWSHFTGHPVSLERSL